MRFHILIAGIKKNKGRFMLILCCLSISIGLLIASLSLIQYLKSGFETVERSYWGNSDIIIAGNTEENTIEESGIRKLIEYQIETEELTVDYESNKKIIRAFELSDLKKADIIISENIRNSENGILADEQFLKDKNIAVGDEIAVDTESGKKNFKISGTFQSANEFDSAALYHCFFTAYSQMPEDTGQITQKRLLIKVSDKNELEGMLTYFENKYGADMVRLTFDEEEFGVKYQGVFVMLLLVSVTLCVMCISIIYSIKKFLISLDSKQYAIIRSVGGNSRYLLSMFCGEGILLGTISGMLSMVISQLFIKFVLFIIGKELQVFSLNLGMVLGIIVLNILIITIINICTSKDVRKSNLKDILIRKKVARNHKFKQKIKLFFWVIVLFLNLAAMIWCSSLGNTSLVVPFILISVLCIVKLAPYIGRKVIDLIRMPIQKLFGNLGYLAIKDIQYNKSFITNISMLTVAVSLLLLINAALYSVYANGVTSLKNNFNYDIIITNGINDDTLSEIEDIKEVEGSYRHTDINNIKVLGSEESVIYSIDFVHEGYHQYRNLGMSESDYDRMVKEDKKIILTDRLLEELNLAVGDEISLDILGNDIKFEIIGKFETTVNNGNFAIASYKDLAVYTETYFKVSDKNKIAQTIDKVNTMLQQSGNVYSRKDYIEMLLASSKEIYNAMYILSFIPVIISLIMSVTNAVFTFYENKKDLFIFKSLGLNEKKTKRIYFLEQYISGTVGSIMGIIFGSLLIAQVKWYMVSSKISMEIQQSFLVTIAVFILAVVVSGAVAKFVVEKMFRSRLISELRN